MRRDIYPGMVEFASDEAWSVPGMTRVMDFVLPEAPFSEYARDEYLIPTDRVAELFRDSLFGGEHPELASFKVPENPALRDMFVCTHGAIDACCAKFGYPLFKLLRHMADKPDYTLRVWRCTHFGGHRFAATMMEMPQGRYWGHLEAHDLGPIVRRDGDTALIRKRYRGWAALPYGAAQVAEGELFRQGGWAWTECAVAASETPPFDWENPVLEEQSVRFDFTHPGQEVDGSVEVLVSPNGFIQTKHTSKSDEWHDAQQFTTSIVPGGSGEAFFGEP